MSEQGHGGLAITGALKSLGVDHLFGLSGAHIFPIFDGCKQDGIRLIDTRHEQSAVFAAEGWSRLTRSLGVAAVTAGPGVTNAMSAMAQARYNGAPVLVLGGRAPQYRWGAGSLQEIDHVPFVDPLAPAATVFDTSEISSAVMKAGIGALTAPRGPRFLDFPIDVLYGTTELQVTPEQVPKADAGDVSAIARLVESSSRPVLVAGSNVWLDRAEDALLQLVESAGIPCFMNGQGRGCVPADHRLAFSRARSHALKESDLVIVAGTALDFRLGFGQGFSPDAKIVHLDHTIAEHVELAASSDATLDVSLKSVSEALEKTPETKEWVATLRATEDSRAEAAHADLTSDASPIHPMRIYGELIPLLDRDAVVIGDGGDFVSYAGREVQSLEPGCWLDPGPFGCLGVGPGYAMAARLAYPDRQVVLLYGDGAIGFSAADLETLVRLDLPVVCIVGNNGIWALEKYPMQALFGYDVAADLQPGTRYDTMMEAFGGKGEAVTDPDEIGSALKRAFDSGVPYLVNVFTDPGVVYPRSANLA